MRWRRLILKPVGFMDFSMADESGFQRSELWRLRGRRYAYSVFRWFGVLLIAFGTWALFAPTLIDHYRQQGSLPEFVVSVNDVVPSLDAVTALIVLSAGLVILHLGTK